MGENPNIPYPRCERSMKIPVFKQPRVPNTGTKNVGKWGELGEDRRQVCLARLACAQHAPGALTYSPSPLRLELWGGGGGVGSRPHPDLRDHGRRPSLRVTTGPAGARLSGLKAYRTDDRPRTPRWHTQEGVLSLSPRGGGGARFWTLLLVRGGWCPRTRGVPPPPPGAGAAPPLGRRALTL